MRRERAAKRVERVEAVEAVTFRSGSDQPRYEEPPARAYPAKKDRKRWCGGHEGREHKIVIGRTKKLSWWVRDVPVIRYCQTCGKEFDCWYFPHPAFPSRKPTPEWVLRFLEAEAASAGTISP